MRREATLPGMFPAILPGLSRTSLATAWSCAEADSVASEKRLEARDVEAIFRAFAEVMRELPPDTEAGWLDTAGDLRLAPDIGRKLRTARGVRDVLREIRQSHTERDS
jgi:hypothetical protein